MRGGAGCQGVGFAVAGGAALPSPRPLPEGEGGASGGGGEERLAAGSSEPAAWFTIALGCRGAASRLILLSLSAHTHGRRTLKRP